MVQASDLVGCRFKGVQRRRFPDAPYPPEAQARHERRQQAADQLVRLLPYTKAIGDRGVFTRADANGDFFDTLELMAAQTTVITHPYMDCEALVRWNGAYAPLVMSTHKLLYPAKAQTKVVATQRVGLSKPVTAELAPRHHTLDGYRVSLADRELARLGHDSGVALVTGQDLALCAIIETAPLAAPTDRALATPEPTGPRRVKECEGCRFWFDCKKILEARDDISLFLSGDKARPYMQRGIHTVDALIASGNRLAAAWRAGVPALRKVPTSAPLFDVEVDVDMEAYLNHGVYLWGTYDQHTYRPFVTWGELGGESEARNFAEFWSYLMDMRASSPSFCAFCYASGGENHWLRTSAKKFAGYPGVPPVEEVNAFISSGQWIDVFKLVKSQLVGSNGLGLKVIAPLAGFTWEEEGVDGEESIELYRARERDRLLRYNRDDCRATAAVRHWLAQGAPGIPDLNP